MATKNSGGVLVITVDDAYDVYGTVLNKLELFIDVLSSTINSTFVHSMCFFNKMNVNINVKS